MNELPLSKWWTTPSCHRAMERVKERKKESIERMKASIKARKEQLIRDVEEWDTTKEASGG